MNKINNLSKKSKIIAISIIVFVLLLIGGTLAWLEWSSEINALVNGRVCAPEIVFLGGSTINGNGLRPISNKENGLKKDISVNLENLCEDDIATMDLYLDLEIFPTELAEESLVWELYKVTTEEVNEETVETLTLLNNGNFEGKAQGDTIELTDDTEIVTSNISNYRLYIYIDGSFDNPNTMQNKFFKFDLYGEGRDAIYKADTIKNITLGQSTTYFLVDNEELLKDNIGSIEIRAFNNIPGTATEIDDNGVLSNDDTVKIFYEKNPETNLNKVYIGTSNGILKMNTKMDYMFAGLTKVESLDLSRLDTSNVTSMVGVFYNSPSLTNINMSTWDTSEVTKMNTMFQATSGLTSLDVSNFDTSKVTTMANMFQNAGTSSLSLDLSNFNTSKVTAITNMFQNCKASSIDVSNFSNDKVTNMQQMFNGCTNLTNLNLRNFKTPVVSNMTLMFQNCSRLETIDVSSFNTSSVTLMGGMFFNCSSLNTLNLSNFDTSSVTTFSYQIGNYGMFQNCSSLISLDLSNFNTNKVKNMSVMFKACNKLEFLDISNFDISNVTSIANMFQNCSKLEFLDLSSFKTFKATSMESMFEGCTELESVNLSNLVATQVTSLNSLFRGCTSLKKVDFIIFETPNLTSVAWMFASCSNLEEVDLSNLNPTNLASVTAVFFACSKLKQVNFTGFDFSKITATTGPYTDFRNVPNSLEVIVDDCDQVGYFKEQWTQFTNVHTPNNDNCTV